MSQFYVNSSSGNLPPEVATTYHTENGDAVPADNIINIYGDDGIDTYGSGNTVTINVVNDGFPWSDQAVSFDANIQNGYFCTAALTVSLPPNGTYANALITGNTVIIYVDTSDPVVIQAAAGQMIEISGTTSEAAGTATSTDQGNIVTLTYRVSDTTWHAISSAGTFLVV